MLALRLKFLFAVVTLIAATHALMEARAGAETVWTVWLYPALALGFAIAIVLATLSQAMRSGAIGPAWFFRSCLASSCGPVPVCFRRFWGFC